MMESFMALDRALGEVVDVVLETSHGNNSHGHTDLYREHIDMPILQSTLWDFEDLLINDGCTGIAVLNPSIPQEVQLDEHKLLIVYGKDLKAYERILVERRVPCREDMRFITEAEHVHSTCERYVARVRSSSRCGWAWTAIGRVDGSRLRVQGGRHAQSSPSRELTARRPSSTSPAPNEPSRGVCVIRTAGLEPYARLTD